MDKTTSYRNCSNCRFAYYKTEKLPSGKHKLMKFQCRRYAPRMLSGSGEGLSDQLFPEMMPDDWCGEHEFPIEEYYEDDWCDEHEFNLGDRKYELSETKEYEEYKK